MGVLRKIIVADPYRKTRLHDEKGNRVPLTDVWYLPLNSYFTARRLLTGRLAEMPWIAFGAIKRLDALLDSSWSMIEFGSGMSTSWYASRVASVHSVEDDPAWHRRIAPTLPENVKYELRIRDNYADLSDYEDESLDFAVVDGILRGECMRAVIPKVRRGGWIYLDNSDKDMTIPDGEVRQAERLLREAVTDRGGDLEEGTGLIVGFMLAAQWQLGRI